MADNEKISSEFGLRSESIERCFRANIRSLEPIKHAISRLAIYSQFNYLHNYQYLMSGIIFLT